MKSRPLTTDCDLNSLALGNAVVLQVDQARCCHLYRAKHSHYFKDTIIKTRCKETVVLLRATPEISPTHKTEKEKLNP
jgi:hypothetical protein